ncbi:MAG: hypothetical protein VX963_00445 [Actinomycetota bacterium]|nr:hypothetical protein [Actinomycetota bacterium]
MQPTNDLTEFFVAAEMFEELIFELLQEPGKGTNNEHRPSTTIRLGLRTQHPQFRRTPQSPTVISDNDLTTIFEITADEVTGMTWDYGEAAEEISEAVCRRLTS